MSDEPEVTHVTGITTSITGDTFRLSKFHEDGVWVPTPVAPKVPAKGVYVLEAGDTPGRVSIKLYGRSHRAVELANLNPDSSWNPGDTINLP
jgi:hypothetical protein